MSAVELRVRVDPTKVKELADRALELTDLHVNRGVQTVSLRGIPSSLSGYEVMPEVRVTAQLKLEPNSPLAGTERFTGLARSGIHFALHRNLQSDSGDQLVLSCGSFYSLGLHNVPAERRKRFYKAFLKAAEIQRKFSILWKKLQKSYMIEGKSSDVATYRFKQPRRARKAVSVSQ